MKLLVFLVPDNPWAAPACKGHSVKICGVSHGFGVDISALSGLHGIF